MNASSPGTASPMWGWETSAVEEAAPSWDSALHDLGSCWLECSRTHLTLG